MSSSYQDRLEGAYRVQRVRRIQILSYIVLGAVAAAVCVLQFIARGPTLQPLYIPLDSVITTGIFVAFGVWLLGIYFRYLEIKYAKNDGQRYLMVQNSMRQAITTTIGFGLVAVFLLLPWVHGAAIAGMSETFDRTITRNAAYRIEGGVASIDELGLSRATGISVRALAGTVEASVQVGGDTVERRLVATGETLVVVLDTSKRVRYDVVVTNPADPVAEFSLTIHRDVFPELFSAVPLALGLFVAANIGWYWMLGPLAERYKIASIFSKDRKETVDAGERVYVPYEPVPGRAPFVDPPPPPPPDASPAQGPVGPVVLLHVAPTERLPPPPSASSAPVAATDERALLDEASRLASGGKFEEALAKYDAVLRRAPDKVAAALGKAGVLFKLDRRPAALGMYRQVLRDDRRNVEALRGCLAIHEADRSWRDALDVVDQIAQVGVGDAALQAKRGDILLALKRPEEARAAFEKALALRPNDPAIRARLDRVSVDVPALVSHAFLASASGNFQAAVDAFDRVLRLEPENLNVRVGKSAALRRLGRFDEARALLDDVLERNPVHSAALLSKGQLLAETGNLAGALESLDALLGVHPGDPDALLERGDILARMGSSEEAQASYEAALKLNPDDRDAAEKLQALIEGEKTHRAVLRELFRVRGLGPTKAKAIIAAGFRNLDDLRRATVKDLVRVPGITQQLAQVIMNHFQA